MTTHIPHLKTDTSERYRNYIHEKIKEVKETMSIKYWHESNQFCRGWWDSIEMEDHIPFAWIEVGCVCVETWIEYTETTPTISYYLCTKTPYNSEDGFLERSNYINNNRFDIISKCITWEEIFNDMLYNLIDHCLKYDIDYEADYWYMKEDLLIVLKK